MDNVRVFPEKIEILLKNRVSAKYNGQPKYYLRLCAISLPFTLQSIIESIFFQNRHVLESGNNCMRCM